MSAAYEAYLPTIRTMMPGLFDVEAEERARLMFLRDEAARSRRRACWQSYDAYATVQSLASELALKPLPLAKLKATRKALLRMTMAARDIEMTFGNYSDG